MVQLEPHWVQSARHHIGLREIPGKATAPAIARWLRQLRAWWSDDETPWCGVFVAEMLRQGGHQLPRHWYRARAYLNWGVECDPFLGCVVIFNGGPKRPGAGHVGFLVGRDERRRLMVLGGNQANAVTIAPFDPARVLGYRWPPNTAVPAVSALPLLASNGAPVSDNEA
jgi:uncharacterized protein (TIGR02594 family)